MSNQPLSEQYRLAAHEWVDLDNSARLLEELKSVMLNERMKKEFPDLPVTSAEREVKSSPQWRADMEAMVEARTKANKSKVKLEWLRMRHAEQQSIEATKRAEMKL